MSASTLNPESAEPMMDINTTPLIDVMLVLLIMFIITIPVQTHAVKLDLPQQQPNQTPPPIDPVKNTINIMPNNAVLWNGTPVDLVRLRQYLDYTTTDPAGAGASPRARSRGALRAGRRGARGHQAGEHHRDGLRRQRALHQLLIPPASEAKGAVRSGRPFSLAASSGVVDAPRRPTAQAARPSNWRRARRA